MISNTFIPKVICTDFSTLKKAISQMDAETSIRTCFDTSYGKDSVEFKQYVIRFVEHFALKAFRKGLREYAYNLRYIKSMLCNDGSVTHINGYVAPVSKKSLYEAVSSIQDFYHNNKQPFA